MPRRTLIAAALLPAFLPLVPLPATADEEVTYVQQDVRSNPRKGSPERVTLRVPSDWDRNRLNRVSVGFFNYTVRPQSIVVDLDPLHDTVKETRAEVRSFRDLGLRYYREYDFRVNGKDEKVRVRWVYAYRDAQTDDTWSYTSVFLMSGERVVVDGRRRDRQELRSVRHHAVRSFEEQ